MSNPEAGRLTKKITKKRHREALEGAIKKWYDIAFRGGKDEGGHNCDLCKIFRANSLHCGSCIVNQHTKYGCTGTPFSDWVAHYEEAHNDEFPRVARCSVCGLHARREYRFLESLRSIL